MRPMRFGWFFLSVGILILGTAAAGSFILRRHVQSPGFIAQTEDRVSELLKADVSVDHVDVGFLNEIAFSDLKVVSEDRPKDFQFLVHKVIFQYDFLKILNRNFKAPTGVVFKAPQIRIGKQAFPYDFFSNIEFGHGQERISKFQFEDGDLFYDIEPFGRLRLKGIQGTLEPSGIGKLRLEIQARGVEFFEGKLHVTGEIDFLKKSHRLSIAFDDVRFLEAHALPLEHLNGIARWEDDHLYFDRIKGSIHGWLGQFSGIIKDFQTQPDVRLDCEFGSGNDVNALSLRADLKQGNLRGAFQQSNEAALKFAGSIKRTDDRIDVTDLHIDSGIKAKGAIDLDDGHYVFNFIKGSQELRLDSHWNDLNFNVSLKLDHFNFYGLDIVALINANLVSDETKTGRPAWNFMGDFQTQYFILETMPIEDLIGHFELSPQGMRHVTASWGKGFELEGNARFGSEAPEGQWVIKVDGFNLAEVKQFAAKPLPKELGGILDGRLKIVGDLRKPEVSGDFTIKDGKIGRLDYNRGIIHFRGIPPYLPVHESKILKGRATLNLTGAIDLSLDNIFHGIEIQTLEKFVLWKGWNLNTSSIKGDLEIDPALGKLPNLALKAGMESATGSAHDNNGFQEDRYTTVGPKFEF